MTDQELFKQLEAFIDESFDGDERAEFDQLLTQFLRSKTPHEADLIKIKLDQLNLKHDFADLLVDTDHRVGLDSGQVLNNYRIIERLADGGMGEVYLAERADDQFDKKVALKILSKGLMTDQAIQRFFRERRILAKLTHPNIAALYDAGMTENHRPWFALEYINGLRIDEYGEQHQSTIESLLAMFIEVCEAISYAHSKGVVHRDLKPANILVDTEEHIGKAMVLDFGIASLQDDQGMNVMTDTGQAIGTPGYMSPEQIIGRQKNSDESDQAIPIDRRSDVFSLGVILYKLLSHNHPFDAASITEINYKVLKESPTPLPNSLINPNLSAVIYQCLEKEPSNRYQSVKALVCDLKSYLSGDPVTARKVGFFQRVKLKLKKHPLVSLLTTLLVVLVLGASWMLISERIKSKNFAKVVQDFAFISKGIEQKIRQEHMMPHHNLAPQYDGISQSLDNMRLSIKDDGMSGPIYATLGQAHLLLNQAEKAVTSFEQSVLAGFSNPAAEIQHGLALALYWDQKRGDSQQFSDTEKRQQFMDELGQNYLQPATEKLKKNLSYSQQAPYLQAYLAFLNKDYRQASQLAIQNYEQDPALYEALRLAGQSLLNQGKVLTIDGKFKEALVEFNTAEQYLEQAIDIGRSDLLSHYHYCELLKTKLHVSINNTDDSFENKLIKAEQACQRANQLLPNQVNMMVSLAEVYGHWSSWLSDLDREYLPQSLAMLEYSRKAHMINSENMDVLSLLVVGLIKVTGEANKGLSEEEKIVLLAEAKGYAEQSIKLDPDDAYNWANLGDIEYTVANRTYANRDVTSHVRTAVKAYSKADELLPSYAWDYMIGNCYNTLGKYHQLNLNFLQSQSILKQADESFAQAVDKAGDFAAGWNTRAESLVELIKVNEAMQQSTTSELQSGIITLAKACDLYTAHSGVPEDFYVTVGFFIDRAEPPITDHCLLSVLNSQYGVKR